MEKTTESTKHQTEFAEAIQEILDDLVKNPPNIRSSGTLYEALLYEALRKGFDIIEIHPKEIFEKKVDNDGVLLQEAKIVSLTFEELVYRALDEKRANLEMTDRTYTTLLMVHAYGLHFDLTDTPEL